MNLNAEPGDVFYCVRYFPERDEHCRLQLFVSLVVGRKGGWRQMRGVNYTQADRRGIYAREWKENGGPHGCWMSPWLALESFVAGSFNRVFFSKNVQDMYNHSPAQLLLDLMRVGQDGWNQLVDEAQEVGSQAKAAWEQEVRVNQVPDFLPVSWDD